MNSDHIENYISILYIFDNLLSMKYETILVLRESHEDQKVIRNELNLI